MTEKRFQWYRDTVALNLKMPIMDNGKKLNIGEVFNELNKLNDENEELKKGVLTCLNDVFRKDLKTLLFVIAVADLQKLSKDEFQAIARLQGYLLKDIVDLEELKGDAE